MSARPLSRIRQLITLCMLAAAVVTIGLVIAGALTGARSPVPQLASQKWTRCCRRARERNTEAELLLQFLQMRLTSPSRLRFRSAAHARLLAGTNRRG